MKVKDVMHHGFTACGEADSLNRAAQLMWEQDIGCLPVVGQDSHPVGMITDRDICMAGYIQGRPLSEITVASVMAKGATCCSPEDDIEVAARLMRDAQIRRLPVTASGKLVGILALNDLAVSASHGGGVSLDLVGETLGTICQHRHEPQLTRDAAE